MKGRIDEEVNPFHVDKRRVGGEARDDWVDADSLHGDDVDAVSTMRVAAESIIKAFPLQVPRMPPLILRSRGMHEALKVILLKPCTSTIWGTIRPWPPCSAESLARSAKWWIQRNKPDAGGGGERCASGQMLRTAK